MITRDMMIADIITQHPETLTVFKDYNLDCYECQIADIETLEHGAGAVSYTHLTLPTNREV